MKDSYTINEILGAMEEIRNIKREKNDSINKKKLSKNENSDIPINTLKLIEEAEKNKDEGINLKDQLTEEKQ